MINLADLVQLGSLRKTHGTRGFLSLSLTRDFPEEAEYVMLLIDNIPVPFYVEDWRYTSDDTLLLKLENVSTEQSAKRLVGCLVYAEKHFFQDESLSLSAGSLIGYTLLDVNLGTLGTVSDIDDSTLNTLLLLDSGQVIPLHEDLLVSIDDNKKEILMNLPSGLFNNL